MDKITIIEDIEIYLNPEMMSIVERMMLPTLPTLTAIPALSPIVTIVMVVAIVTVLSFLAIQMLPAFPRIMRVPSPLLHLVISALPALLVSLAISKLPAIPPIRAIRVETGMTRMPIHHLAKDEATTPIEIRKNNKDGELILKWEVSSNSKYGHPGPLAYKLDILIVNRHIDDVVQSVSEVPRLLRLGSLKRIAKELRLGGDTESVKKALLQNSSVYIRAKLEYKDKEGTGQILESNFNRYEVHFAGAMLPDGSKADAVYLHLNDCFWRHQNSAQRRPLDYDYLVQLAPVSLRWYELASFHVYGVLNHGGTAVRMQYGHFCQVAPQVRNDQFGKMKKQMLRVLTPHLKSGYIRNVDFQVVHHDDGTVIRGFWRSRAEVKTFSRSSAQIAWVISSTWTGYRI